MGRGRRRGGGRGRMVILCKMREGAGGGARGASKKGKKERGAEADEFQTQKTIAKC